MKIEFIYKDHKLKRKHSEAKIQLPKDKDEEIRFDIEVFDDFTEKTYLLVETPTNLYRLLLKEFEDGKYYCEVPSKVFKSTFFKIRLYSVVDDKRKVSNTLIIPFAKTNTKVYRKNYPKFQYNNHKDDVDCDDENNGNDFIEECDEDCDRYADIFQYLLDITKESINKIIIDNSKAYAYHEDDTGSTLVQIIPLPNWVTKEELNEFMGDVLTDVELDQLTGDVYKVNGELKFSDD